MTRKSSDVVIVGAGVIGAAVAYYLSKLRLSITVVNAQKSGAASFASAGGLWPIGESVGLGCGVIFFKTLSRRRRESGEAASETTRPHAMPRFFLDFCMKSNAMFPSLSEELREAGGVDFKLERTGLKFLFFDEDDRIYAKRISESVPHLSNQLRWLDAETLWREEPNVSRATLGALAFEQDDQVNPYLLTQAYQAGARAAGVRFESDEAIGVATTSGRVTSVRTTKGEIPCGTIINAAGAWAAEVGRMAGVSLPVFPVKGQIVLSERLPKVLRSCLSTSDCYMAQKDHGEILIGSTTEEKGFDTSTTFDEVRGLCDGALKAIPALKRVYIKRAWAGLRPGSPDEIPILGAAAGVEGYLNACGHFRTGILTSAITGEILRCLVAKEKTPIPIEPFLHSRFNRESPS